MSFGVYNQAIIEGGLFLLFLLVPLLIYRKEVHWKWFGLAIGLFVLNKVVLFLGVDGSLPDLIPGRYNWEGKIAAIFILGASAWFLFPKQNKDWGFTLSQQGDAPKSGIIVSVITAFIGTALALFYFGGVKDGGPSDWLYQLTMPGIHEEIYYRGIMLLILDQALRRKWKTGGVNWTWGAVVLTAMFYITHITRVDADWNVAFVWGDFLPGFYGLLLMHIRLATGSLLLPILLHGWINTIGYLL